MATLTKDNRILFRHPADAELIAAAERVKRYNDEPIVNPDPWCDQYDS